MIDGGHEVPAFVSDDREVVVRAGVLRVERHSPPEKIARLGRSAGAVLRERQVDERFDVPCRDPDPFPSCTLRRPGDAIVTTRA